MFQTVVLIKSSLVSCDKLRTNRVQNTIKDFLLVELSRFTQVSYSLLKEQELHATIQEEKFIKNCC